MEWIGRNFGLKATAVVVAAGLWFTFNYYGATRDATTKTVELAIAVRGIGSGLTASARADRVSVTLGGSRADLDSVSPARLAAFVDCTGKGAGVYSLPVSVVGQNADKVRIVDPSATIVTVDRYAFRTVPVIVRDAHGGPIANARLAPAAIQVGGAESAVASVVAAEVQVPEPRALPAGFAAEMKPTAVDDRMQPVPGATVIGVVSVVGPAPRAPR